MLDFVITDLLVTSTVFGDVIKCKKSRKIRKILVFNAKFIRFFTYKNITLKIENLSLEPKPKSTI